MGLSLPPAVSIKRFLGGYKSASDYNDLDDGQTNDAMNVIYNPFGDIQSRAGSERLYNRRLTSFSQSNGAPITGHYFFSKVGSSSSFHVVAAGDSVFSYNSSTANYIATSLDDNPLTLWSFTQMIDPRVPTDDLVYMTNGIDPIRVWNGSGTATRLDLFTSASQVPIGKYILTHKQRLYVANLANESSVDQVAMMRVSGFGTDGAPDPHRFSTEANGARITVGGADSDGVIQGIAILNDQIIIYKEHGTWKYNPGTGDILDTTSLFRIQESIGVLAPKTLVDIGGLHLFLSNIGVVVFNGSSFQLLSEDVNNDLITNSNNDYLKYSYAVFNRELNQYVLYFPDQNSTVPNKALVYDIRQKIWQPPFSGRKVSVISKFFSEAGIEKIIYGDNLGYLYEDNKGVNDGIQVSWNASPTNVTGTTLDFTATTSSFPTSGDGLKGLNISITDGQGLDQTRTIQSNTSNSVQVDLAWGILPTTASTLSIAAINSHWRSKDYDFGFTDIVKLFRHIRIRPKETGNYNLTLHYIVDFKILARATAKAVSLLQDGLAWGVGTWAGNRWGGKDAILKKISLRSTEQQSVVGNFLAVRFSNNRANQEFRITGFDMELKPVGKR